jgi:Ulp1 family protease
MHACLFKYVHRFHWILLIIKVDAGTVEYLDSLDKSPNEYKSLIWMLDR